MLFFEKRNQKTFARLVPRELNQHYVRSPRRKSKSFLLLFFKKEGFSDFTSATPA
jgi:hypothetical protein